MSARPLPPSRQLSFGVLLYNKWRWLRRRLRSSDFAKWPSRLPPVFDVSLCGFLRSRGGRRPRASPTEAMRQKREEEKGGEVNVISTIPVLVRRRREEWLNYYASFSRRDAEERPWQKEKENEGCTMRQFVYGVRSRHCLVFLLEMCFCDGVSEARDSSKCIFFHLGPFVCHIFLLYSSCICSEFVAPEKTPAPLSNLISTCCIFLSWPPPQF